MPRQIDDPAMKGEMRRTGLSSDSGRWVELESSSDPSTSWVIAMGSFFSYEGVA